MNSIKRNPHMLGEKPLEFDNVTVEDLSAKTKKEKSQLYLIKFKKNIKPFTRYSEYFSSRNNDTKIIFSKVKTYYIKYVLEQGWSEKKYTASINNIFANNGYFSPVLIEENGKKYDDGTLLVRRTGRRRRI